MKVSATRNQVSTMAARADQSNPNRHATAAVRTPVRASTSGYRNGIGVPQLAQRPPSAIQEATGMLCHARMGARHCGQADLGTARLNRAGAVGAAAQSAPASAHCSCHSRSRMIGRR